MNIVRIAAGSCVWARTWTDGTCPDLKIILRGFFLLLLFLFYTMGSLLRDRTPMVDIAGPYLRIDRIFLCSPNGGRTGGFPFFIQILPQFRQILYSRVVIFFFSGVTGTIIWHPEMKLQKIQFPESACT